MDRIREFLEELKAQPHTRGDFLGLLHVIIGRSISRGDGTLISAGVTWRELSALLKKVRWDKDAVVELGLDPSQLPPRDRQRYWFQAIALSRIDSAEAFEAGNQLAKQLEALGYQIGTPPGRLE